jgi:hypothetical protein
MTHDKTSHKPMNDGCLGFSHDPVAAPGFVYADHRCFFGDDGKTQCHYYVG